MYLVLCTNTVSMFIEKLLLSIRKLSINQKSTASFVMSLSQKSILPLFNLLLGLPDVCFCNNSLCCQFSSFDKTNN